MARVGRKQELKRQFSPLAMIGFSMVMAVTWQATLFVTTFSLPNGGPAGAVIMYLFTAVGLTFTSLSLAEMASIAPTAGGQYHWVSELAPPSIQKQLSFIIGWAANYAWQSFLSSATHGAVSIIQGLITLYHPEFLLTPWQQALVVILLVTIMAAVNVGLLDRLPDLEFIVLGVNTLAFIAFEVTMLVMGPRVSAAQVFQNFENFYNWPTMGGAVLAGLFAAISSLTYADSVAHMGEELENAAVWLPRTIILGGLLNYLFGFIMLLTFLFRAENIPQALQANPTTPFLAILENITGSKTADCIMGVYIAAFSRDGGVPFSTQLRKVTASGVPFNAIVVTWAFNVILALIVISPTIAFRIIGGLAETMVLSSYMMSICTVFCRRLKGPLPKAPFSLGLWGIPINICAVLFTLFSLIMAFFPTVPNPTLVSMNWSSVVYVGLAILPFVLYAAHQRHVYIPPVELVRDPDEVNIESERK
ncbi:hypothetical protein M409DRAFT_65823 [Zasmidium cellare ATCC 36951]|uniref:Amino acid permease/ SLC12A domain-containing protein n=1 Tax=Zasmidium cellare ATCC 36951 TaxID=1080233 RepID=A0A6A6CKL7_ZASCE|nr:uncharacterized protein M409DRAFT_65823 [Zasmidium cellare ATCC 36951]KAF2167695.1 hypothetical protein M409DRAFT_65823 [Zasmidium cellare ATCC 36951]